METAIITATYPCTGNAGFETADYIVGQTAYIHMMGRYVRVKAHVHVHIRA